jgi:hypothetical protein
MAPPHLRQGAIIDDEKLLMRALRCMTGLSAGASSQEFTRLYQEIAASYFQRVNELRNDAMDGAPDK